jgi:hypothetical protein
MKTKVFFTAYLILALVMFALPFFSAEGYSIVRHTTSQLGAQNTPNAWVMNATFALMGLVSIYGGWSYYEGYWFQRMMLLVFGLSLALASVFSHAPISPGVAFDVQEDKFHSLFASTTGFGFTLLAISTGFIKRGDTVRVLPIAIGILATVFSMLIFSVAQYMGVWQRLLFLMSFAWLIYEFSQSVRKGKK